MNGNIDELVHVGSCGQMTKQFYVKQPLGFSLYCRHSKFCIGSLLCLSKIWVMNCRRENQH